MPTISSLASATAPGGSTWSAMIGRQPRLDHRRSLAGADRVADHAVAPASRIVRARLEDRSRAAAPVAPSPGIARSGRRAEAARRKREVGAGPLAAQRRIEADYRFAPLQGVGHY